MRQWAKDLGIDPAVIKMLGDGDASFHEAVGESLPVTELGTFSIRWPDIACFPISTLCMTDWTSTASTSWTYHQSVD